jgi:hypothetical protein
MPNAATPTQKIPWYFRPGPFLVLYVFYVMLPFIYIASKEYAIFLSPIIEICMWLFLLALLSWPFLLYSYLAPHAHAESKHYEQRCNKLYATLVIFFTIGMLLKLFVYGPNNNQSASIADITLIPVFYALIVILWRTSDLLVEIENRKSFNFPDPVFRTFNAFFLLPLFIFWFSSRLRRLKRTGKIT